MIYEKILHELAQRQIYYFIGIKIEFSSGNTTENASIGWSKSNNKK